MFQINWDSLINLNLPTFLRKPLRFKWLSLLISEVVSIYQNFIAYRTNELYWIKLSGQKVYMEKMLNDTFDNVDRGIFIDTANDDIGLYIYQQAENPTINMTYVLWNVNESYLANDRVVFNAEVYQALVDNQGYDPSLYPATWVKVNDELLHVFTSQQFNNTLTEDFVINIPMSLVLDESYMMALVNRYKLADKTYSINYY